MYESHEVRTIIIDPERAAAVAEAFTMYASGGYSIERLAQALKDRGA